MCGITGKISFTDTPIDRTEIVRMNDAISHRGPDGTGVYISPNTKVGLGHTRLAIIDVSPKGAQPMRYKDRYEITFNGEIYNFQEQRKLLEKEGYTFTSHTDTEVILALYDKYKERCVEYIRGMFAFALYDEQENIVFCARDRAGQKPFKFYRSDDCFIFASEIKSICTQKEYKKTPDAAAIRDFLVLQYVPAPKTGFTGIEKLEPATYMTVHCATGAIEKKRYWDLSYQQKNFSKETWKKEILDTLTASVHEQMVADVPVGAMLSGGIDSSIIVALMAQHTTSPIETFTVGFTGETVSELPYATQIAKKYKTSHHELRISPASIDILPSLVQVMDEPFGDHGALPTLLISEQIKKHVKVVLNGDGGDENFAGYDRYTAFAISELLSATSPIAHIAGNITRALGGSNRISRFLETLSLSAAKRYAHYVSYVSPSVLGYPSSFMDIWNKYSYDGLSQLLAVDFHTYLPGALLPKVDSTTMAYSIEARSPFLDHRLLEMSAHMPSSLKIKGFTNRKYILKEVSRELVPHEIIHRKKQGFSVPLDAWFQEDLMHYIKHTIGGEGAMVLEYIPRSYVASTIAEHEIHHTRGRQLWILLMLELWLKEHFG